MITIACRIHGEYDSRIVVLVEPMALCRNMSHSHHWILLASNSIHPYSDTMDCDTMTTACKICLSKIELVYS
jgi:hypothetical protein